MTSGMIRLEGIYRYVACIYYYNLLKKLIKLYPIAY